MRRRRTGAGAFAVTVAASIAVALAGCSAEPTVSIDGASPDAGVQLFQLPWTSIADECEQSIGPAGFGWVLTSPPQESITGDAWWTSYQPVSYELDSKLGTREEFAAMVSQCDAAGVAVIADAVVNHMAGVESGTGFAGTPFSHYDYPGLYTDADFHHCGLTPDDDIADYSSRDQVQTCELVNLADLDTSSDTVRAAISGYLTELLDLGVSGFRIDAAKHMSADDVQAIVGLLPADTRIMSEAIRGSSSEPIQPEEYTPSGEVFEFQYARDLGPQVAAGFFSDPDLSAQRPSHVPAASALVFVDNHDTERGEAAVTFRDGPSYLLANVLMLADDYGTPVVYSGYAFDDRDAGPPTDSEGRVLPAGCADVTGPQETLAAGERTCVHAWSAIAGMLEWRAVAGDAPRLSGISGGSAYGFERDGRAVVAVNAGDKTEVLDVPTTLPAGEYCDVISGGREAMVDDGCRGEQVTVRGGVARMTVPAQSAVAIHLGGLI